MDRLSELPDTVLAHTLSFLPTKDAVKTTILSKRFENQWTSIPNLVFHQTNSTPQFVNQTLALWGGAKTRQLNKFDIEFPSPTIDARVWVRFAVDHDVENLRLVFANSSWDNSSSYFTLPQHLYSNYSIQSIEIACCVLSPRAGIDWGKLKKLSIKCVRLSNELIKILICGSAQLELFEICDCKGYDSLILGSSQLKILRIKDNLECSDTPVTISAPNITKLCIEGVWYRKITLVSLSALVDAELEFSYRTKFVEYRGYHDYTSYIYRVDEYIEKVLEMLQCHLSTERLVVGTMFIEALTKVETLPPQLSKCRSFTLCTNTETNVLKGILNMVKMLPNLEALVLDMELSDKWYSSGPDVDRFLTSEVKDCKFIFQKLKVVKIICHLDRRPALPFIKFLLEHSQALETMSIFPKTASSYSIDYMFQLIKDLSDMPRSSPIAKVSLWKGQMKIQVEMNSFNLAMYHLPSEACPSKSPRIPQRPDEAEKPMDSKNPV